MRRDPSEARERILAAAEQQLVAHGPDGVRLTEIARAIGVTHPAILHHFGNREALVEAVVARALERRYQHVVERLSAASDPAGTARNLMDAALDNFERESTSRVLAWLALSEHPPAAPIGSLRGVTAAVEELRRALSDGRPPALPEASAFAVHLGALVLLAEPLYGPFLWAAQGGRPSRSTMRAFRTWFAEALTRALLAHEPERPPAGKDR